MPCKTCNTGAGLQVCLFCGHSYCGAHRGERDGAIACAPCLEAEHGRRSARSKVTAAAKTSDRAAPANGAGDWMHVGPATPPPPPLKEPVFWTPILAGASAAIITAAYLWFFLGWLLASNPALPWAQPAAAAVGAAAVFFALWIIVKSRTA